MNPIDPAHLLGKISFEGMQGSEKAKISLFVISKKEYRFRRMDSIELNGEKGAKRLNRWSQESRFVAVIEMGGQIYAHVNEKMADKLKEKELTLDDKKVVVKTLSAEDYAHVAALGQALGEFLLAQSSPQKEESQTIEKGVRPTQSREVSSRRYLADIHLLDGQIRIQDSVDYLKHYFAHQAISTILSRMAEARREEEQQRQADEKKDSIKKEEIKQEELKREIKNESIKKEEIKRSEKQRAGI